MDFRTLQIILNTRTNFGHDQVPRTNKEEAKDWLLTAENICSSWQRLIAFAICGVAIKFLPNEEHKVKASSG
jgi:hypothetical protein